MSRPAAAFNACLALTGALAVVGQPALILPLWIGFYVALDAL